ncbi:MAG: ComEA family DNA-binding protein [Lachnospiraceae bacterium]|nr:ComEA family DNA-binding protein [Lachnospiraceae bacterium]
MRKATCAMASYVMVFVFYFFCLAILTSCGSMPYEAVSGGTEETSSGSALSMSQDSSSATSSGNKEIQSASATQSTETTSGDVLCVYVCGAVSQPGVYQLPAGSRVYAAIAAAGGLASDADPRQINQAAVLNDGQQITVLTKEEIASGAAVPGAGDTATGGTGTSAAGSAGAGGTAAGGSGTGNSGGTQKVNINTATAEELQTLSGIGASRARDIINYRAENGSFQSIEDIMKVTGIKTALFNKIKDQITVN